MGVITGEDLQKDIASVSNGPAALFSFAVVGGQGAEPAPFTAFGEVASNDRVLENDGGFGSGPAAFGA
ncbi:MAG: hypothetical protein KDI90_03810 [Alphaproteobacteria bacterium]|nr:hypothetical protein [Alphaproteobacteria bacterium]MCB9974181.1 hypothetical protein [Rhodospirillales bacterium]